MPSKLKGGRIFSFPLFSLVLHFLYFLLLRFLPISFSCKLSIVFCCSPFSSSFLFFCFKFWLRTELYQYPQVLEPETNWKEIRVPILPLLSFPEDILYPLFSFSLFFPSFLPFFFSFFSSHPFILSFFLSLVTALLLFLYPFFDTISRKKKKVREK